MGKKELAEECKTLGISDKGNKAALIERIKETWAAKKEEVPVVEAEEIPVIEAEEATEIETSEPVVEESAPVEAEVTETEATEPATEEEDAPVEDWTKKELAEECKTLGISDKGNKAALIERIKV